MQLKRFSDRIWYLPHSEETDRPILGYVRGDRCSLMIDAGNSPAHVELFCHALREQKLPLPDYCVLTHWHWDHTFGIAALKEQTPQADGHPAQVIACTATSQKLAAVADWEWTDAAMRERLRTGQDIEFCDQCIRREYHLDTENPLSVHIGTADLQI